VDGPRQQRQLPDRGDKKSYSIWAALPFTCPPVIRDDGMYSSSGRFIHADGRFTVALSRPGSIARHARERPRFWRAQMNGFALGRIHPTAVISDKARIGANVSIGAHCIVYDNVEIGDGTIVGPNSILGEPLAGYYHDAEYVNPVSRVGRKALVRSGAIVYAGALIGDGVEFGHRVTIREGTDIGAHVRIGTLCDVQGFCKIGTYSRLHSNVFVAQKSAIGNYVWIFPHVVLTNDPQPPSNDPQGVVIDDFAVIATQAVIMAGVRIGHDALVGASALVTKDVDAEAVVVGVPAKRLTSIRDIRSASTGKAVYPWREHFERGMPWEGIGYQAWAGQALSAD
jgi:acetyltransferase-like isoleucine patch superfamily enzyme